MAEAQPEPAGKADGFIDFQALVTTHGDRLLRSAYLLCGDATEAQDLVQETFLQAIKSANRFHGGSTIYTWLYGILRNLCHHHLRKQTRLVFEEEVVLKETSQPEGVHAADQDFCTARIVRALQRLSPEHREVVVLRYYENLKIHEIAEKTGISKGTVKSRLFYAVQALQHLLPCEMNLFVSGGTHTVVAP